MWTTTYIHLLSDLDYQGASCSKKKFSQLLEENILKRFKAQERPTSNIS